MWLELQLEGDAESGCLHLAHKLPHLPTWPHFNLLSEHLLDRQCVFVALTLAAAQVLDLDAFLLLTGCLLHLAGVVIGTTV